VSANIQISSKLSDSFYCFSDFHDQSNLLLAVCNVLSAERDVPLTGWVHQEVVNKLKIKCQLALGFTFHRYLMHEEAGTVK
jgi:hypothetical protein